MVGHLIRANAPLNVRIGLRREDRRIAFRALATAAVANTLAATVPVFDEICLSI